MKKYFKLPFYLKLACTFIILISIVIVSTWAKNVIVPLIIGFLLAIILTPFARTMEKYLRFSRTVSGIMATVIFSIGVILVLYILGSQLTRIAAEWPAFQQQIIVAIHKLQDWVSDTFKISNEEQLSYITENASKSINIGTSLIESTISSLSSLGLMLMFTFLYTLFILMYRRHIVSFLLLSFNQEAQPHVISVINNTQTMVKNYLIGLFIQMILVSLLFIIAYSIIGVKYAILLAFMTGLLNVIPYIGIIFSMLLAMLISFATGSPSQVIYVIIAVVIINAVDGNIIMPKIIGSKVKVNSLAVVIGLVLGEKLWGIMGMLLTIPILALTKIMFDHIKELKPWGYLMGEENAHPDTLDISSIHEYFEGQPQDTISLKEDLKEKNHQTIEIDKNNDPHLKP